MQDCMNVLLRTQEEKTLQEDVSLTMVGNFLSPSLPPFFAHEMQTTLKYFWVYSFYNTIKNLFLKITCILTACRERREIFHQVFA